MGDYFSIIKGWIASNAWWIVLVSVVYFLVSLFFIRFFIISIPPDYFVEKSRGTRTAHRPLKRALYLLGKNILGIIVIVIGLIMSIPGVAGQGVLTVLLGLTLTDFPGKRRLEIRIIRQPLIRRAIASMREKAGKIPLVLPPGEEDGGA